MSKKRLLGCSFPIAIGIIIFVVALLVIGFISGAIVHGFTGDTPLSQNLAIERPHVQLPSEILFHVGPFGVTNTLITTWISMLVLVFLCWAITHRIKIIPSKLQNILEWPLEWMLNFCIEVAGEKNGRRFFPLVTTIFLFVLMNAWMNLIPGYGSITVIEEGSSFPLLRGANTDINLPLALAVISCVFVTWQGFRGQGFHFLKTFVNFNKLGRGFGKLFKGKLRSALGDIFMGIIDAFVGLIEFISYFSRIISFTFRLFGNMTGGEVLILTMIFLVPWVLAIPFYGIEMLVGTIQALAFSGLTLVFATMASTPHEEEKE